MLICVVEEWADIGDPSDVARLAQIRALMELKSVDRAWARLKPMLDPGEDPEVFRLAGRLLLERGEVKDARTTLARGRHQFPDDDDIQALLDEADEPGTVIDVTDPMEDDPDGQAALAERLLIEGAPLKARRVLERVRKGNPDHTRTADLLWALDGDFRLRGVTLQDLARVHAAPTQSLADLPDDTDQTAEADGALEDPDGHAAFPTLFKNLEEQTEAYGLDPIDGEREVTRVSAIVTDAGESNEVTQETTGREDTQIMHVVRTQGHSPDASAADTLVDGKFDLKAHEQALKGESEDENVVVHRKAQSEPTITETDAGDRIKLDPSRDRVQQGANKVDEGAEFIRPRKKPQVTVEPAPPKPKSAKSKAAPAPKGPSVPPPKAAPPPTSATPEPVEAVKPRSETPPSEQTTVTAPRPDRPAKPPKPPKAPKAAGAPSSEPAKPRLTAAPSNGPPAPTNAVKMQRLPTDERPRIDPAMAAAPTEILDDPTAPRPRPALAPWTGWLLVLVLFGLIVLSMGSVLILYQVVTSM